MIQRLREDTKRQRHNHGFTIVELVVVISIIGILATITIVGFSSIQQGARNSQRSSEIAAVAEALEKYYMKNGEYPSCTAMTQSSSVVVSSVLPGLDPANLTAPSDTTGHNSFQCTDPTTPAQYGYLTGSTSYTLKYKEEGTANVPALDSRHHIIVANYVLSLSAGSGGTVNSGGTYASGTVRTITATPSANYSFTSWTGSTGCSGTASHTITMDANKTCTATFALTGGAPSAPAMPDAFANISNISWGTTCISSTANYDYDLSSTDLGFDSGWSITTDTSEANPLDSGEGGYNATLEVRANCSNINGTSDWSATASTGYEVR